MPTITVLCGIPGSGKTTLSEKLAADNNATLYCFDKLRGKFRHMIADNVRLHLGTLMAKELCNGCDIVYDDLNTKKKHRINLLRSVAQIDCKKVLIVMTTPFEECVLRNANRFFSLPNVTLHSINKQYEAPELDEGWDEIIYY